MAIKLDILRDRKNIDNYRRYSYADLKLDLELNSRTPNSPTGANKNAQDLRLNYDTEAIHNSVSNIFNTKKGQKILNPTFGLDLEQYLFENITKENANTIGTTIYEELPLHDNRVTVNNVEVIARPNHNEYKINISIIIPSLNNQKDNITGTLTTKGFQY
jgi:phage baseplate assembly protein W